MPTYEYLCDDCGHNEEIVQKISADAIKVCPGCKSKTYHRVIGVTGFILKGSGWYKTDYAGSSKKEKKENVPSSSDKPVPEKKKESVAPSSDL